MYLTKWNPFRELRQMDETMNRLWREVGGIRGFEEEWTIPLDVTKKEDELLVKASLPGVDAEKINVSVEDNVLTISADVSEEKEEEKPDYLLHEMRYGSFYRALRLPESVDAEKIESCYDNGILYISLPMLEEKKKKKIDIKIGKSPKMIEGKKK